MTTAATSTTETHSESGPGSVDGVFSAAAVQASGARVLSLLAEAERLTAEAVGELGLIDRAGLSALWGYTDTTRLVAHRSGRTRREAHELVVVARHIARHPATGAALTAGEISFAQAAGLARAASGFDDVYSKYEPQLLAACRTRDADALARLVAQWRDHCDTDKAATDAEHRFNQRGVHIQTRLDGSCKGTFQLDPVATATVSEALFTRPDPTTLLPEPRTLAQRRADRLTDICHHALHPDDTSEPGDPDTADVGHPDDTHPDTADNADAGTDPGADTDVSPPSTVTPSGGARPDHGNPDRTEPPAAAPAGGADPDNGGGGGVGPDWDLGPVSRQPRRQGPRGGSPSATDVIIDIETLAGGNPTTIERLRSELASGAPIAGPPSTGCCATPPSGP